MSEELKAFKEKALKEIGEMQQKIAKTLVNKLIDWSLKTNCGEKDE